MSFEGEVLRRGFWLYLWKIESEGRLYFYVGRTGDSSSPNAASPFNRIGQHLDFRKNAKGNSLAKRLNEAGVNPMSSSFRMLALGPFFPEQQTFEAHKPFRDKMATMEYMVAQFLADKGANVLGTHHLGSKIDKALLLEIQEKVIEFLEDKTNQ